MRRQSWDDCVGEGAVIVVGGEVEVQVCFAVEGHQGNPSIIFILLVYLDFPGIIQRKEIEEFLDK